MGENHHPGSFIKWVVNLKGGVALRMRKELFNFRPDQDMNPVPTALQGHHSTYITKHIQ